MNKKKLNLSGPLAFALSLLVLAVAVPINLFIQSFDIKYDTTPSKLYTLSDDTVKLLDSVRDKKIEIYFLSKNITSIDDFLGDSDYIPLYYALKQYEEYENITVTCFNPNADPVLAKSINPGGLYRIEDTFIVKCGTFTHKIDQVVQEELDNNGNIVRQFYVGEKLFAGAFKTVTEGEIASIYYLTGHGEPSVKEVYTVFDQETRNVNYHIKELDLNTVDAVPDDAAIVYLCGPKIDITQSEKAKLLDYSAKGGHMTFFLSPNEAKFNYSNIEDILSEYNIGMDYNKIRETTQIKHLPEEPYSIRVDFPPPAAETDTDMTSVINELVSEGYFPYMTASRSFYQKDPNQTRIELNPIMSTLATADSGEFTAESERFGGEGKSVMEDVDNMIPDYPLDIALYAYDKHTQSKLAVFGSAEFINDENIARGTTDAAAFLCLSTISWMYDSEVSVGIGNKERAYDHMAFSSETQANGVIYIMGGIPAVVALAGVIIWWRRRSS